MTIYGITNLKHYSDIASAIRSKTGLSESFSPSEMASAIETIQGGGGDDDLVVKMIDRTVSMVDNSELTYVGPFAFDECTRLTSVNFPAATAIGNYAFCDCQSLTSVSVPAVSYIGGWAFNNCNSLMTLYLGGSRVVTAMDTAFNNTPLYNRSVNGQWGSIYVPASLYSTYLNISPWSGASLKARLVSY